MTMKINNLRLFLGLLVVVALVSCKSKTAVVTTHVPKASTKLVEQLKRLEQAQPTFTSVNVTRLSASIEIGGRKFSTQANCKLITDSCIHVSIQPMLGIEMFKIEITKDSIIAFDKFNKKMYLVAIDYFKQRFNMDVDFNDIQSILLNRFFTVGSSKPDVQHAKLNAAEDGFSIISYQNESLKQKNYVNNASRVEKVILNTLKPNNELLINYSEFGLLDKFIFPQRIVLSARTLKNSLQIDFKIQKAMFDVPISFTSIDRSKFSKADINQLMSK